MRALVIAALLALLPLSGTADAVAGTAGAAAGAGDTIDVSDEAVQKAVDGGIAFLLESQNGDGSWGGVRNATFTSRFGNPATYNCWTVGTTGLATLALLEIGAGEAAEAAAGRGLEFLMANADLRRPADWDVDNVWGLIYGLNTLARAVQHPWYRGSEREDALREAATTMLGRLTRYQSPRGGWGYYAGPDSCWRPEWATSFTTAAGVVALTAAKDAGLDVSEKHYRAAVRLVERCRLPNGAYSYSAEALPRHLRLESIDQIKGSLGRIQVCNYALHLAGVDLPEGAMQEGIELFFRHHRFLDVGRNKPIPHEAYYAVAAYFYLFAHYYAAHAIETLPEESRDEWFMKLRGEILKCRQEDGSFWDFWIASCTKPYGTAFSVMALARTLKKTEV